jgi:hypothetical protein
MSPLTPSELVLLNGQLFAEKAWIGNVSLLHTEAKVSATQLGQAMFAAAFLAADQAGSVQLQVRQKKVLLGLGKTDVLYADPGDPAVVWPEQSLESRLRKLAEEWQHRGDNEVAHVLYSLLGQDSANPWQEAAELVKAGLAARGLLRKVEERKLKILVFSHYELPESTSAMLLGQPVEPVQQLLTECQSSRPQVWKLLVAGIKKAIKLRTEQAEADDD